MERDHNWPVWGHDWAVTFLRRSMAHGRNRHAYLISGTPQIGKMQLALSFAMALNCEQDDPAARPCGTCASCRRLHSGNHPDLLYSVRDERTGALKIDAIRDVTRVLALKPFSSRYRVAIFESFDSAQDRAQDALLKTLEEPPPHAVLILLAQSTEQIMPTITSRCQLIRLRPISQAIVHDVLRTHGASDDQADLLARLSSGRLGWALDALRDETVMVEREDMLNMLRDAIYGSRQQRFAIAENLDKVARKDRPALLALLETWQTYWRDVLLLAQGSPIKPCNSDRRIEIEQIVLTIDAESAHRALLATRKLLTSTLKTNANVRLALEAMFLDYPHI